MQSGNEIIWPAHYQPSHCPIHVRNEIDIAAPADHVWAWLIRAPLWPTWYVNSANVRIISITSPDLALGTTFRWKTFGVNIESIVQEFVPGERIAWNGTAFGLEVYHAWLIQKTATGCHVINNPAPRA
ncbi:MAG: SRPBCC family protein, partial [Burkholderiales bacterium]